MFHDGVLLLIISASFSLLCILHGLKRLENILASGLDEESGIVVQIS